MKILITQKIAGISGSELYIKTLLLELKKRNIVADFIAIEPNGSAHLNDKFINEIIENGINVFRIPYHGPFSLKLYYRINKILRNGAYDILQTNLLHADIIGSLIKVFFFGRFKIISTKHGYDEAYIRKYGFNSKSKKIIDFYALASKFSNIMIDRNISVSNGLARLLIEKNICKVENIEVIPLGFDFSYLQKLSPLNTYRFSSNQLIIIGRLTAYKQQDIIIRIMPEIIKIIPDIKLVIVGNGREYDNLINLSKELSVSDHIIFTGYKSNAFEYYYDSDIKIVPSVSEPFGIVILEAWHSEVPVIAFDVPAPNEIITDGEDGFLIPPFNKEVLKEKILYLLKNKDIAKNMGKAGKKKLESQYTMEIMLSKIIDMYNSVLKQS